MLQVVGLIDSRNYGTSISAPFLPLRSDGLASADLIATAYGIYKHCTDGSMTEKWNAAKQFKGSNSPNVRIHFVGVWDTVSAVGVLKNATLPFTSGSSHIHYFRQALALVRFFPPSLLLFSSPPN
jgi:uncharacterized protein (DUF2235 family)